MTRKLHAKLFPGVMLPRRNASKQNSDQTKPASFFCMSQRSFVLLILTIVGILLFVSGLLQTTYTSSYQREELVQKYNRIVKEWESTYKTQMKLLNRVSLHYDNRTVSLLKESTNADNIAEDHDDVFVYSPFKFVGKVDSRLIDASLDPFEQLVMSLKLRDDTKSTEITLPMFSYVRSRVVEAVDWEDCFYTLRGSTFMADRSCRIHESLESICVKIGVGRQSQRQRKEWSTDSKFGGIGCSPGPENDWSPFRYRLIPAGAGRDWVPSKNMRLNQLEIQIRSARDPFVVINHLTDGDLHFGPTQGDYMRAGCLMMLLGMSFLLPAVIVICSIHPHAHHHQHHHHRHHGHHHHRHSKKNHHTTVTCV